MDSKSKSWPSDQMEAGSDGNSWSSKTPEKPIELRGGIRNRGVALSLKEVRKIAQGLRNPEKGCSDRTVLDGSRNDLSLADRVDATSRSRSVAKKPSKSKLPVKLPEKYEMLGELFDCMVSSIRLLQLRGSMSTFANICPKIETLTDRRFSYAHLAQLKYILSEAIEIKKILLHDERTYCMKPDLQVTLQLDAFENGGKQKKENGYFVLGKMFRNRLSDFVKAHPEGEEVPEETLPEPFNRTKPNTMSKETESFRPSLPVEPSSNTLPQPNSIIPSHLSRSFQRRISKKIPIPVIEKTPLLLSTNFPEPPSVLNRCLNVQSPIKCFSEQPTSKKALTFGSSPVRLPISSALAISEEAEFMEKDDSSPAEMASIEGTPAKLISTPAKLMSVTPELQTPKRCRMSPNEDSISPHKSVWRPTRTRSLTFLTPVKNAQVEEEKKELERSSVDLDIIKFLPETLLQSVREKERKAKAERDVGLAEANRRQLMIACLPKLFNMIQLIFQSIKRTVITKEELIHKIITSHSDIVDRREVEEQLNLLEELVPDWISGKMASSGDFLFCISKTSDPNSIHRRLAEAI